MLQGFDGTLSLKIVLENSLSHLNQLFFKIISHSVLNELSNIVRR